MKTSRFGLWLLLALQLGLFSQYAQREILWAYPGMFDQATYLVMDYTLYRDVLQSGIVPALGHFLQQSHPTGVMMPLQDAALHFFIGPGRMPDLLLNFGYFALLEGVLFHTVRWLTGRPVLGWVACGLLMMQQTAFVEAGGMFDCRIDFIAYCLYGVFVCLLVRSDGLREKRWLAAAAGGGLLLVSFRFIAFAYLLGFAVTLFTALLGWRLLWRGRLRDRLVVVQAMRRIAALAGGLVACGGAVIAFNWRYIHDYYVVGHLTGNEKHIRAAEMGVTNLAGHLTYYFASLWSDHLGALFIVAWAVLAAGGVAAGLAGLRREPVPATARPNACRGEWLVQLLTVCASLFAPWFILTLDESKSPVVANVLSVPVTLLLFLLIAAFDRPRRRGHLAPAERGRAEPASGGGWPPSPPWHWASLTGWII